MNKFAISWQIFKRTWGVMWSHQALLFFPIVITLCTLCIGTFFLAPIVLQPTGYSYTEARHWKAIEGRVFTPESVQSLDDKTQHKAQMHFQKGVLGYLWVLYFISMFLAAFFNTAFCSQIIVALKGGNVSIGNGLRFAMARWKAIFLWSLMTGLVGAVIRKLEESFGIFGRIVFALIGMVWSVASIFAIPVIVENPATVNPLAVLRQSAGAIRKTWGEALIGYAGLAFTSYLLLFGSLVILGMGGIYAYLMQSAWPILFTLPVWFAGIVVLGYISSVASQIYQCALYLYATSGAVPVPFDRPMMDVGWKRKSQ